VKSRIITFSVKCRTAKERQQAERLARKDTNLKRTITATWRSFPGGVEKRRITRHLMGDHFDRIEIEQQTQTSFYITFAPSQDAPNFWKDLMVIVLRAIADVTGTMPKAVRS
jgi:hypothetical protein